MAVNMKGLFTPPDPETRDIAYLDVEHNGETYDWIAYVPRGVNVGEYLASIEQRIYSEIDAKEAEWAALEPKTRTISDPFGPVEQVIAIEKSEIVRPDSPDYYAKRRAEYPSLGDQLDAMWKGLDSPEFQNLLEKIQEVKAKYPKP